MGATIYAAVGTGASLRLFRTSKKMVDTIGGETGIRAATDAEIVANAVIDTGELMKSRDIVPINGSGKTAGGRPKRIRFLCAKDKVETLMTTGKVTVDTISYRLVISGRRQVLR